MNHVFCRFGQFDTSTLQLGQILEFLSHLRPLSGEYLHWHTSSMAMIVLRVGKAKDFGNYNILTTGNRTNKDIPANQGRPDTTIIVFSTMSTSIVWRTLMTIMVLAGSCGRSGSESAPSSGRLLSTAGKTDTNSIHTAILKSMANLSLFFYSIYHNNYWQKV